MTTRVVAVDDPGLPWVGTHIPGSTPEVRLARLHADPRTRASVSLVHFPEGWARPGTGHYTCAEELVVIDGWISVSGHVLDAGSHVYLPARTARTDSVVGPVGCLALAWFSAAPDWRPGRPANPPEREMYHRPLRGRRSAVHPGARFSMPASPSDAQGAARGCPGAGGAGGTEVFSLGGRQWAFAPTGREPPELAAPVLLREWS